MAAEHLQYMRRCFDLARHGSGTVSPNPLVGAVVVYHGRIIGEGYHHTYGEPHAERNAIASVPLQERLHIPDSTLYVSLEPCCHHGKTPPCTDLIISLGIRTVYLSTRDPNPLVCGKGIETLRANGIAVREGLLVSEGEELIRYFRTSMRLRRPHIILKTVQSADGFIGKPDRQVWLSNDYERVMVHKLRSEVDAIMVGTNTAVLDNPRLTTRDYPGHNPIRVILDRTGRIPLSHHIYDGAAPTVIYTDLQSPLTQSAHAEVVRFAFDEKLFQNVLTDLHNRKVQSVLVEGGSALITALLQLGLWDEALVVRTPKILESGIRAPLIEGRLKWRYRVSEDDVFAILPDSHIIPSPPV